MAYDCRVLADSVNPVGCRLTTMEITFPRIVLAEFNTHRMLSRNSASSRAIPVEKQLAKVLSDPFIPVYWGKNQKGMKADQELDGAARDAAFSSWHAARDYAVECAKALLEHGVHKQITNRLLEPFMWHTAIVSATDWDNFFGLRCHPDAQPEIRVIAEMMRTALGASTPRGLGRGEWHLPLVYEEDEQAAMNLWPDPDPWMLGLVKVSAGRCARVSYLTHDGKRDLMEDVGLCDRLLVSGHMSPLEHPARALARADRHGNFAGFMQYRKTIPGEDVRR